jgi:hypothetical protein
VIGIGGFPELTFDALTDLVEQETPLVELQGIEANSLTENDFTFGNVLPLG